MRQFQQISSFQFQVSKTNIQSQKEFNFIYSILKTKMPIAKITIDSEDCDKVLRIERDNFLPIIAIEQLFSNNGFFCKELD